MSFHRTAILLAAALLLLIGGCTTTLTPAAKLQDPQDIYILDHGRTSSLVIPDGKGGMIRYAYGDWDWYALRKTGLLHAIAAVCWPTQGALGREQLPGPPTLQNARRQAGTFTEDAYALPVARDAVARLRSRLEEIYAANIATEVHTPSVGLSFVRHPDAYWWSHDSNHEVAKWLREMGVEVRGPAILSRWQVEQPLRVELLPSHTVGG